VNATEASTVFRALGDETRLEVLRLLGEQGGATATTLAQRLPITRQGVAKHIGVLADAGLVDGTARGRAVVYRVRADVMTDAAAWLERAGAAWDARLARLRAHLEGGATEPKGGTRGGS
jgi:ArsR family transcriptional regulator, cadmium/lead-responsive transcriptional repressor